MPENTNYDLAKNKELFLNYIDINNCLTNLNDNWNNVKKSQMALFNGSEYLIRPTNCERKNYDDLNDNIFQLAIQSFLEEIHQNGMRQLSVKDDLIYFQNFGRELLLDYLFDSRAGTSCHPTAEGLRNLMGKPNTIKTVGGVGEIQIANAIDSAIKILEQNELHIIQIKSFASNDGHSFSLLMNSDDTVTILEAWAMGLTRAVSATLPKIWEERKVSRPAYLTKKECVKYLEYLKSSNDKQRDKGYGNLTSAYGNENQHPSHHFESDKNNIRCPRNTHNVIVTSAKLKSPFEISISLFTRYKAIYDIIMNKTPSIIIPPTNSFIGLKNIDQTKKQKSFFPNFLRTNKNSAQTDNYYLLKKDDYSSNIKNNCEKCGLKLIKHFRHHCRYCSAHLCSRCAVVNNGVYVCSKEHVYKLHI